MLTEVVVTSLLLVVTSAELFSSMATLQSLARQADDFLISLPTTRPEPAEHVTVTRLREWTTREALAAQAWTLSPQGYVEHPVAAINLIARCLELGNSLGKLLTGNVTFTPPEDADYDGAVTALVRIQRTYKLATSQMAAGNINNVTSAHGLGPRQRYDVGAAWMTSDHIMAKEWFDLLEPRDVIGATFEGDYYEHLMEIYHKSGNIDKALNIMRKVRQLDPDNFRHRTNEQYLENLQNQRGTGSGNTFKMWRRKRSPRDERHEELCRGEGVLNDIRLDSALVCVLRSGALPYVVYKEEIHSVDPRISLFYDVITDEQVDNLQKQAIPRMYRAKVGDPKARTVIKERVGQLCWLKDDVPGVAAVGRKVSDITGLATAVREVRSEADAFQVVNYGLGGQYGVHVDFYPPHQLKKLPDFVQGSGHRIATFMFYMNEVTAGGATVFPELGVRIEPVKHGAAFWYNFPRSGVTGDKRTKHAGCPVLLGQKWVANKWIRGTAQLYRRPCGLTVGDMEPLFQQADRTIRNC